MNFVIPMAGLGSRFVKAGFALPKPLIPVEGEAMYRWAVSSLDLAQCTRLVFVLRKTEWSDRLEDDIRATFAAHAPRILTLDHVTRGQAETVWLTRDLVDLDRPVLVHNSDTAFTSARAAWAFDADDGVLLTFDSTEERWSFARVDANGLVDLVAEKVVISRHASTGTYYFRDGRDLFARLEDLVKRPAGEGELYLAPLYNDLVAAGRRVTIRPIGTNLCFGTPADLTAAERLVNDGHLSRAHLVG